MMPIAALAREPGTYWRAQTDGSPVATEIGRWSESDDGRMVRLEFLGGHVAGRGTRFVAGWLSPFTTCGRGPCWTEEGEVANFNEIGDEIEIALRWRFRYEGKKWSGWLAIPHTFERGTSRMGWGGQSFHFGNRPLQFEWRLKGHIKAPTYLEGWAELSIN